MFTCCYCSLALFSIVIIIGEKSCQKFAKKLRRRICRIPSQRVPYQDRQRLKNYYYFPVFIGCTKDESEGRLSCNRVFNRYSECSISGNVQKLDCFQKKITERSNFVWISDVFGGPKTGQDLCLKSGKRQNLNFAQPK